MQTLKRHLFHACIHSHHSNTKTSPLQASFKNIRTSGTEISLISLFDTFYVSLQAKTTNLDRNDPLLHQDYKKIVEDQDLIRCHIGYTARAEDIKNYHLPPEPLVPLGRHNTTCGTWLRMPIHDIDSPARLKSRQVLLNYDQKGKTIQINMVNGQTGHALFFLCHHVLNYVVDITV